MPQQATTTLLAIASDPAGSRTTPRWPSQAARRLYTLRDGGVAHPRLGPPATEQPEGDQAQASEREPAGRRVAGLAAGGEGMHGNQPEDDHGEAVDGAPGPSGQPAHRQRRRLDRLDVALPGPLPAWVTPGRLDQVLDNLLANALDASPRAGRVAVTATRSGDRVELHVTDEGPGLSDQDRERAFDRFWQAAPPHDGDHGGFGLGLAIVRQLLIADGGSIELRPAIGAGLDVVVRVRATAPV